MTVALIILAALVLVGALCYMHQCLADRKAASPAATAGDADPAPAAEQGECCGMHITCEKDSLLAAVSSEVEYYDDEELDAYRGRSADEYDDDEIEQFRDVLLTLLPDDIAGWGRSLQLRGITMPAAVRDELLMIVAEQRKLRESHG